MTEEPSDPLPPLTPPSRRPWLGPHPLDHPTRRRIYDAIAMDAGITFRGLARTLGLATGTCRHHVNVLGRKNLVQECKLRQTVRLFPPDFDRNLTLRVVALREPNLKILHDWIKKHPGRCQRDILDAMLEHGWSRSTTQHRLSRLVRLRVAKVKLQGRLRIYYLVSAFPDAGGDAPADAPAGPAVASP